jgi:hypothetical protein
MEEREKNAERIVWCVVREYNEGVIVVCFGGNCFLKMISIN